MRAINSPKAFKTCYIADVKEELGLLKRKRKNFRKVKAPEHLKVFIKRAIEELGRDAKYRDIQQKALELYRESLGRKVEKYFGVLRLDDDSFIKKLAESETIYYE